MYACVCVCSPIVSFCQSDDTTIYYIHSTIYSDQRFLLPFFVSVPETAQRIQGPLTTRVIIGPGPVAAAASELRVSARPLPCHYIYIIYMYNVHIFIIHRKVPHDLFYYMFFLSERNIPIIHGCGTETETHLRLRVLIIFISSCRLIIIPSSAQAHINTAMVEMVQRQRGVNNKIIDLLIKTYN